MHSSTNIETATITLNMFNWKRGRAVILGEKNIIVSLAASIHFYDSVG